MTIKARKPISHNYVHKICLQRWHSNTVSSLLESTWHKFTKGVSLLDGYLLLVVNNAHL